MIDIWPTFDGAMVCIDHEPVATFESVEAAKAAYPDWNNLFADEGE